MRLLRQSLLGRTSTRKTFRVVREFEGGQPAHGFAGLCVQASLSEANEKRLTLFCSDDKGHPLRQSVLLEFCSEVKEPVMLHLFILFFASLFVICFYVFFCICLICFYMTFCIFYMVLCVFLHCFIMFL